MTQLRSRELERVTKDWSIVIRASQIIPVYLLTEDLQPRGKLRARDRGLSVETLASREMWILKSSRE